jgi:hypothetical protein
MRENPTSTLLTIVMWRCRGSPRMEWAGIGTVALAELGPLITGPEMSTELPNIN